MSTDHDARETQEEGRAPAAKATNVGNVTNLVQLRFDAAHSPSHYEAKRAQLRVFAGRRMTAAGVVVIISRRFRTQDCNRQDAYEMKG